MTLDRPLSPLVQEITELIQAAEEEGEEYLAETLREQRERMLGAEREPADVLRELGQDRFELEMRSAGIKAGIQRLQARKRAIDRAVQEIRDMAVVYMEQSGLTEVDTGDAELGAARLVPNGGKAPLWTDPDIEPSALPSRFTNTTTTINGEAVREALEAEEELRWARLDERGRHVRWG